MRSASLNLLESIRNGKKAYVKAFVEYYNGTSEWLYDEDFMANSISLSGGTSSSGTFDVGGAIIGSFNFTLNNWDDKFDNRNFEGAKITAYVGMEVATFEYSILTEDGEDIIAEDEENVLVTEDYSETFGNIEWLRFGTFWFVSHRSIGNVIICETYDSMKLFDENLLSDNDVTYPIQARQLARIIAAHNGVTLANAAFANGTIQISELPEEDITERQAISYIAQLCGLYAKINSDGALEFNWYQESIEDRVRSRFDHSLDVENVTITGVRVYYTDDTEDSDVLSGREGYVISVRDNPFINSNNAQTVAQNIAGNMVGMIFRPGDMTILADPRVEPGDTLSTYDDKGNLCTFYVTNLTYTPSLKETVSCDAEPIERTDLRQQQSNVFAERVKKNIRSEMTAYDAQYMELSRLMTMSMGMFETREYNSDGSFVLYLHNKPNLADSDTVWKKTADAFSVSTNYNGARTWNAGITASGNALVNILSAVGINAGWVETGLLTDAKGNNKWNLDTGEFTLNSAAKIGTTGYTLAQIQTNAQQIDLRVTKNGVINAINVSTEGVQINASKINLTGYVTVNSLGSSGTTTVNGGRIKGGTITLGGASNGNGVLKIVNANNTQIGLWNKDGIQINAGTIKLGNRTSLTDGKTGFYAGSDGIALGTSNAFKVTSAGAVTASNITITGGELNINSGTFKVTKTGALTATSATVTGTINATGGTFTGTITCSGTISGGKIVQTVKGSSVGPITGSGNNNTEAKIENGIVSCGMLEINNAATIKPEGSDVRGYTGIYCDGHFSTAGPIWISSGPNDEEYLNVRGWAWARKFISLLPSDVSSDRGQKQNINSLPIEKAANFVMSLQPVSFEYKTQPNRKWHGFIAQDVERIAYEGWGVVSDYTDSQTQVTTKTMSYQDIIADLVSVVQQQEKRIIALEGQMA